MLKGDARYFQLAVLTGLLAWGLFGLDFEVSWLHCLTALATAQATQWVCTKLARLPRFDPRSALISSLSLCLLLRTDSLALVVFAAVLTIASKFVIRWKGRHVFNPTSFGIAVTMLLTSRAWVSAGQWGNLALFAFLLASVGCLVVYRAARADVTLAFLATYASLLLGRALSLTDPLAIPAHQLQSGALILFAFFMISDPKTTPAEPAARLVFAVLVAGVAYLIRFRLFHTNDLIWSLVLCAPAVPLLDRAAPLLRQRLRGALSSTPLAPSSPGGAR